MKSVPKATVISPPGLHYVRPPADMPKNFGFVLHAQPGLDETAQRQALGLHNPGHQVITSK
jgi:hypothetical protein